MRRTVGILLAVVLAILAASCTSSTATPPPEMITPPPPTTTRTATALPTATRQPADTTPIPTPTSQTINQTMPVAGTAGASISYYRTLQVGDAVSGSVQLTGQPQSRDGSYVWTFQVVGPGGQSTLDWTGNWSNNYYYPFSFTASAAGTYKVVVTHHSSYPKQLTIQVAPPGWQYAGN